ncbi:alcohol dehydrogenase catalytic domain-containing protein [Gammaproteobacteria bacterium]|nr:alcohol dehydrogenase catalytic domain-containing protein [Gammaproteobacteria bacterium]
MTATEALVVRAEERPLNGVAHPGPHQLYRRPKLSLEQRELGPLPAGHIRLKMIFAGLCGTDVHVVQENSDTGYIMGSAPLKIGLEGRILGHEGVGQVVAVGDGVGNVKEGDYVTLESIITCHYCDACRKGKFNQCEGAQLFGMERDGLFRKIADVPAQLAHDINDLADTDVGLRAAACIEPAACGYVATSLADVSPGDNVLIFGAGPIGLFTSMLCRAALGAAEIHVIDPIPFRREFALDWADRTYDVEEFFFLSSKPDFNVLIETSGVLGNVGRSLRQMASNSRIILLARSGEPLLLQHVDHMITNNISITGSRGHLGGAFADVLRLYRAGNLPLQNGITTIIEGLDNFRKCLEHPVDVVEKNCKVLVRISD